MSDPFQSLCLCPQPPDLMTSAFGPFVVQGCATLAELGEQLGVQERDAVLIDLALAGGVDKLVHWSGLPRAV